MLSVYVSGLIESLGYVDAAGREKRCFVDQADFQVLRRQLLSHFSNNSQARFRFFQGEAEQEPRPVYARMLHQRVHLLARQKSLLLARQLITVPESQFPFFPGCFETPFLQETFSSFEH